MVASLVYAFLAGLLAVMSMACAPAAKEAARRSSRAVGPLRRNLTVCGNPSVRPGRGRRSAGCLLENGHKALALMVTAFGSASWEPDGTAGKNFSVPSPIFPRPWFRRLLAAFL